MGATSEHADQLSLLLLSSSHVPVAAAAFLVCVCPLVCSVLCYVCTSLLPPSLEDEMKGGGARDKEEEEAGRSLSGTVGIRCRREKGEGGFVFGISSILSCEAGRAFPG